MWRLSRPMLICRATGRWFIVRKTDRGSLRGWRPSRDSRCRHGVEHRPLLLDLEYDRGDPRWAAQGIRCTVAQVLGLHSVSGRNRDAAERAVGTTIHRNWRERAGKDAPYENELLKLPRAAHAVIVGGSDEHSDLLVFRS